ncbi:hypothetical protein BC835DRAFT_1363346 [Cytidiella melzeri]|nr:hypothetical protein BC835DRAFT_1363346 [Cytidiella melzeri]
MVIFRPLLRPSNYSLHPVDDPSRRPAPAVTITQSQSLVAYLWLVWYQASSSTSPKHWALAVTYELHERAYATFYEITGDGNGMGQFLPRVVRRVHLTGTHGHQQYDGKMLLGEINDSVLGALEMYGESAVEIVNSHNRKHGLGESNCQDWAMIIIRSLEDSLFLPRGTLAKVEKCPRYG